MPSLTHERFVAPPLRPGSDRAFGIVFTVIFGVWGLLPLLDGRARWWSLAVAAVFGTLALLRPRWLAPLNWAWIRLGRLLGRIVNPIVMAVVYFGVITPTGLALRLFGKDPLRLRYDRAAASYWLRREPPAPPADSMSNQF